MIIIHSLEFFLGELSNAGLLELLQPSSNGLIAHKDCLADLSSGALNIVDLGSYQYSCSTQTGRPSTLAHPVPLHPLDQLNRSESDPLGLSAQIQGLAVPVDVERGVYDWQLTLKIEEFEQFQEATSQLEQVHVHLIAEID